MKIQFRILFAGLLFLAGLWTSSARREGRQWTGPVETTSDCSFAASGNGSANSAASVDRVDLCNFTLSGPQDGVYPFRKGLASLATWLGGPTTDASNSADGGFVFFETSSLSVQQLAGVQAKAWLKTPIYQPTTANGNCLKFSYNIQGVSASELKLLRVQLLPVEVAQQPLQQASVAGQLIVNSILLPTVPGRQQFGHRSLPEGGFASPWTPYRSILLANQTASVATGWQEVVDEVWLSSDSTDGHWRHAHVTYSSPHPHAFLFEAVPDLAHLQYRGHVAIDDVKFTAGPCNAECEFNADFCQWTNAAGQSGRAEFDWSLSRGSLWTHTGPVRDQLSSKNNFNFGGYAFIDSRQPHYPGSRAVLSSNQMSQTKEPLCFNFWVHMFGAGIGQLRVLQKAVNTSSSAVEEPEDEEIWRLSESGPRDTWYRAQVTISSSTPFRIELEATVGESGYGDIAVDSFRMQNGPCPIQPERAGSIGSPASVGSPDCTFQTGTCGWVVTNSQPGITSMWTRATGDLFAGRPNGHSQQNVLSSHSPSSNQYMLFDTWQNGHRAGSRGFLSAQLDATSNSRQRPHCLSFWAYMAGTSPIQPRMGGLEVVLFEPNVTTDDDAPDAGKGIVSTILWRLENHQKEKWFYGQVSFTASRGGYVSFVGIRAEGIRGIIAIDDVTVYRESCPTLPMEANVSPLDCSFDLTLCGWTVDSQTVADSPVDEGENMLTVSTTTTVLPADAGVVSSTTMSTQPVSAEEGNTVMTTTEAVVSRSNLPQSLTDDVLMSDQVSSTSNNLTDTMTDVLPPTTPTNTETPEATTSAMSVEESISTTSSSTTLESTTESMSSTMTSTSMVEEAASTTTTYIPTTTALPTTVIAEESRTTATTAIPTTTATETTSTANPNISTSTAVVKESTQRGIIGDYDEVTSYGTSQTIEVISTSRNGGTKSIIISQPGRIHRLRRQSSPNGWVGYNKPPQHTRDSRIVHLRKDDTTWQRPMPVPYWLRGRHPTQPSNSHIDSRGHISPHHAFRPLNFPTPATTAVPKLFAFQPVRPFSSSLPADVNNNSRFPPRVPASETSNIALPAASASNTGKWTLSGSSPLSLNDIRDHTFQLAEGGYVFMESREKPSAVSRLFSPELTRNNVMQCLSFFFAMVYDSNQNTTLAVYRKETSGNGTLAMQEVWRVTSAALDRSDQASFNNNNNKSPWIPARIPIPASSSSQTIVIEGSCHGGGIALDDIRLQPISCSIRP